MLILLEDLLEDFLQKIFGEEIGGCQWDPDPLYKKIIRRTNILKTEMFKLL